MCIREAHAFIFAKTFGNRVLAGSNRCHSQHLMTFRDIYVTSHGAMKPSKNRHAPKRHAIERSKQCKKPFLISEWTGNAILHFQEWAHAATEKTSTHRHIVESSSTNVRPCWPPKCMLQMFERKDSQKKHLFFYHRTHHERINNLGHSHTPTLFFPKK